MPSTYKTPFLGLNKWQGSDKPRMEDFNADNQRVDDAVKAHQEDQALHITPAQQQWLASPFVLGSYQGNGSEERLITLGFSPRFVLVFGNGRSPFEYSPYLVHTRQFMAAACGTGGTSGIFMENGGFSVLHMNANPPDGTTAIALNANGVTYHYLAAR